MSSKLSALTAITTVAAVDLLYIATSPFGSTDSKKITFANFLGSAFAFTAGGSNSSTNSTDASSVSTWMFQGDRATVAINDEAYISFRLSNGSGTQKEVARQTWAIPVITAGSEEGRIDWSVMVAGTITKKLQLSALDLSPSANDGVALGTTSLMWSDLFLASGSVINWNNGDVIVTHSANTLAFAGASTGYTFDSTISVNSGTAAFSVTNAGVMTLGYTALATAASFTITSQGKAFISIVSDTDNTTETDTAYIKYSQDGAQVIGWAGFTGDPDTLPDGSAYTGILQNNFILGSSLGTSQGATLITRNSSPANVISMQITGSTSAIAFNHGTGGTTFTGSTTTVNSFAITSNSLTTGSGFALSSSSADTGTRSLFTLSNSNAASTGTTLASLTQSSTGTALLITTATTTTQAVYFSANSVTTGEVLRIQSDALTTGYIINAWSNSSSVSTRTLFSFANLNVLATAATTLDIVNSSTGKALNVTAAGSGAVITSTGNAIALYTVSSSTTTFSNVFQSDSLTSAGCFLISSASTSATGRSLMAINNTNAAAVGVIMLQLNNSASGYNLAVTQTGINDANACYGLQMNIANAGAGLEYAFRFDGSEKGITAAGNLGFLSNSTGTFTCVGYIRVDVAGTEYRMPYGTIA